MSLEADIDDLWQRKQDGLSAADTTDDHLAVLDEFLTALEAGEVRAAEKSGGEWEANAWVKQGILLNFGLRETVAREYGGVDYHDVLHSGRLRTSASAGPATRRTARPSAVARTSVRTAS